MKKILIVISLFTITRAKPQLVNVAGGTITIAAGAKIQVSGDVVTNTSIQGTGTLTLNGTSLQTLSMNNDSLASLEIDNANNIVLGTGSTTITSALSFINGKLKTADQDLILTPSVSIIGAGPSTFVWTDGIGKLKKQLAADITDNLFPLGVDTIYLPAYATATGNTYNNAFISIHAKRDSALKAPLMIANYINAYWSVAKNGITGGTVSIKGQYNTNGITGTETKLAGYFYNGTDWSSAGETHDYTLHQVSAPVSSASGVLYAMNNFVAVGARAFLQGPYNPATGLMSDALRAGTNLIPLSDPYRSAPYNTYFSHVNNPVVETAQASVFADQASASNNIVDWVFLELRNTNASPGNTILQTRSALLQRDGDIVDVDGVSPVTFNNVPAGNYAIAVRHRNHLGLSLDPVAGNKTFSEGYSAATTTNLADLALAPSPKLYGNSFAASTHPTLGTVNMLWAGNAATNNDTKYTGLQNDKDYILINTLNNDAAKVLSNVYSPADINMDRTVRYNGLSNDKDYLYIKVLGSNATTQRLEVLPN